jgi:hypothetical protein
MEFLELQYNFLSTSFAAPKTQKSNLVMEFWVIYPSLTSVMRNNLNSGAGLLHAEFWSRATLGWSRAMPNTSIIIHKLSNIWRIKITIHWFEVYKITNVKYSQKHLLSDIIKKYLLTFCDTKSSLISLRSISSNNVFQYIESQSHLTSLELLLTINSSQKYFNFKKLLSADATIICIVNSTLSISK